MHKLDKIAMIVGYLTIGHLAVKHGPKLLEKAHKK